MLCVRVYFCLHQNPSLFLLMEDDDAFPPLTGPASTHRFPAAGSCWSGEPPKVTFRKPEEPISGRVFRNQRSSKGISVAVVDANAIIHGDKLTSCADKFVTVSEVLNEVRDPVSRQRLVFLPIQVETMEPAPDALKKVVKFARETGDLQTLSDVDIKVIALAYTLESQIHGNSHLREKPPPLHMVNVRNLPEPEMLGWGKNVPNLAEWEALEHLAEGDNSNNNSKILSIRDLSVHEVAANEEINHSYGQENGNHMRHRFRQYNRQTKEINIEGKKMVANGVDASQGECDDNCDDWKPAVSRSTHRRYLRRKARRELESDNLTNDPEIISNASSDRISDAHSDGGTECPKILAHEYSDQSDNMSKDEFENSRSAQPPMVDSVTVESGLSDAQEDEVEHCVRELDQLEISSQTDGSVDIYQTDDASSEQSWALGSLSESTVACVTSDFAMQNVLLQIGLRLLVPGGMQIRQLHRWVLRCHACNKVTAEIGRIFCPKCGNGGTLRKVSVTVGENGMVLSACRPRINLRGTKFSLPMPQGGRDGIRKNLILREDQLPQKFLNGKKKKDKNQDFFSAEDVFSHGEMKGPLQPPVGKTVAILSGRRNLNDNHFSRRML